MNATVFMDVAPQQSLWEQLHQRVCENLHAAGVGVVDGIQHERAEGNALAPESSVAAYHPIPGEAKLSGRFGAGAIFDSKGEESEQQR